MVLVSVVVHGATATPLSGWYGRYVAGAKQAAAEEREGTAGGLFARDADDVPRMTVQELAARLNAENPPVVLDVRTPSQYERDDAQIPGSARVQPDQVQRWAATAPRDRLVVAYCT